MARANFNKSEDLVTNTTAASKYSRVPNKWGVPNKSPGKTLDLNLINVLSQINVLVGQLAEI